MESNSISWDQKVGCPQYFAVSEMTEVNAPQMKTFVINDVSEAILVSCLISSIHLQTLVTLLERSVNKRWSAHTRQFTLVGVWKVRHIE